MKQQITTVTPSFQKPRRNFKIIFWILIPLSMIVMFFLFGFTSPQIATTSSLFSFTKNNTPPPTTSIDLKVNEANLKGLSVREATLTQMEQTDEVFSKILEMSVADRKGNLVALSLHEVVEGKGKTCITSDAYFGNEHNDFSKNKAIDLGHSTFSNSSNLVLERKDGSSAVSRNGWIKIDECDSGLLSGSFHFEVEENGNVILSEGKFENVKVQLEG